MNARQLDAMRDVVQEDIGQRGLCADPVSNLITACPDDFRKACESIAETKEPAIAVVTGFFIPTAQPPAGETDGPLGALFLARALTPLGIKVVLVTDGFCRQALKTGLAARALENVGLVTLSTYEEASCSTPEAYWCKFCRGAGRLTHLIALERVGPSHTSESVRRQAAGTEALQNQFIQEVPQQHQGRCHTMRGIDITDQMSPAHFLFEMAAQQKPQVWTIGIGDGGNEIGMGKIAWETIRRNIPGGGTIACRVPTNYLIVCGISNWGAYALATGIRMLLGVKPDDDLYDSVRERELLGKMVDEGPLVDGVLGKPSVSVDGLSFDRYVEVLVRLRELGKGTTHIDARS
jgi:D-glutamate cyclase